MHTLRVNYRPSRPAFMLYLLDLGLTGMGANYLSFAQPLDTSLITLSSSWIRISFTNWRQSFCFLNACKVRSKMYFVRKYQVNTKHKRRPFPENRPWRTYIELRMLLVSSLPNVQNTHMDTTSAVILVRSVLLCYSSKFGYYNNSKGR